MDRIICLTDNDCNKINVDIILLLIIALADTTHIHQEIDDIYKQKESAYYKAYKEYGKEYESIFNSFLTVKSEKGKKVAGIVLWEINHDTNEHMEYLIKKGFKRIWNQIINRKVIQIEDCCRIYLKNKMQYFELFPLNLTYAISVCVYLCIIGEKEYQLPVNYMINLKEYISRLSAPVSMIPDEFLIDHKAQIVDLYKQLNISKQNNEINYISFLSFIRNAIDLTKAKKSSPFIFLFGLSGLNIFELFIDSLHISNKELDTILALYLSMVEENDFSEKDLEWYLITALLIKAFLNEYKNTKEIVLSNIKEEYQYKLNEIESKLLKKEEQIKQNEISFVEKYIKIELENRVLKEQLQYQIRERERVELLLDITDKNNKELLALKKYLFQNNGNEKEIEKEVDKRQQLIENLKKYKYSIVGGNPNWQRKIKDLLPSCILISIDDLNRDFNFIDNLDAVFINTDFNSHALYERVMSRINKNNTKLFYLSGSTNIESSLRAMWDCLKN